MLVCSKPTKESVPGVLAGFSLAKNPLCTRAAGLGEHSVGCRGGAGAGAVSLGAVLCLAHPPHLSLLELASPAQKILRGFKLLLGVPLK